MFTVLISPCVVACLLLALSLALQLGRLAQPNEVHYGKYVAGYPARLSLWWVCASAEVKAPR